MPSDPAKGTTRNIHGYLGLALIGRPNLANSTSLNLYPPIIGFRDMTVYPLWARCPQRGPHCKGFLSFFLFGVGMLGMDLLGTAALGQWFSLVNLKHYIKSLYRCPFILGTVRYGSVRYRTILSIEKRILIGSFINN